MKAARVRSSSKVRSRFDSTRDSFATTNEAEIVTGSTSTLSISADFESQREMKLQSVATSNSHALDFSFQGIGEIELGKELFSPLTRSRRPSSAEYESPYEVISNARNEAFRQFKEKFHDGMEWKAPTKFKDLPTPVFEAAPEQTSVYVKYHLPQAAAEPIVIQALPTIVCEKLLQHLCNRHLLDYSSHSFEIKIGEEPQQPVEMNKYLGNVCQNQLITDLYVVKKAKIYKTMPVEEFGESVMNCTVIEGK